MDERYQVINDALEKIYADIVWIEESELRKSVFSDITIKEMYDHQTASQVAKKLHLTPGTLTATIDRLCRKGYAERIRGNDDRRIIRIGLTKKGRLVYRAHDAFHRMMVKSFLKDLNPDEIKTIEKAIHNLEDFLKEHS